MVLPFTVTFRSGLSVHEQVVFAAKRAIVAGRLQPGDAFPSVRALSLGLRINPNTAHKIVATLVNQGLLEVRPGIGTLVTRTPAASSAERRTLLNERVERLVVEARKLGIDRQDVLDAVEDQWARLDGRRS
jgi:GntR family transcriptional regulator